jgi:hypothetical protein
VTRMQFTFKWAEAFNSELAWDTSKVIQFDNMNCDTGRVCGFSACEALDPPNTKC